jgi:hypothetical protein
MKLSSDRSVRVTGGSLFSVLQFTEPLPRTGDVVIWLLIES